MTIPASPEDGGAGSVHDHDPSTVVLVVSAWSEDTETGMRARLSRTVDAGRRRDTQWAFTPEEVASVIRSWLDELVSGEDPRD